MPFSLSPPGMPPQPTVPAPLKRVHPLVIFQWFKNVNFSTLKKNRNRCHWPFKFKNQLNF